MSRDSGRWPALAVPALFAIASSWAVGIAPADAQTLAQEPAPRAIADVADVDFISQTPATISSPAVIHIRVAAGAEDADFRARLYAPVTTRAELTGWLSSPAPGPPLAGWMIDDVRRVATDGTGTVLAVPIRVPDDAGPNAVSGDWPLPLSLELVGSNGSRLAGLHTFLTAAGDPAAVLAVAMVLDLRLPPSHLADGGAAVDEASLERLLGLAEVLTERGGLPLSVSVSPETLDALALVGDDAGLAVLQAALHDRQLLTTAWTSLDLHDWARAVRLDVVLDGLRQGAEALRWAGLQASPVMHVQHPPALRAVRAVTGPAAGVTAFVADGVPADGELADGVLADGEPVPPVTLIADAPRGRNHLMAQSDPLLGAMLQYPDPELGAQWALAELSRMAAEKSLEAVVVSTGATSASAGGFESGPLIRLPASLFEPAALALLLDGIDANASLSPATVDEVLANHAPVGAVDLAAVDRPLDPRGFDLYLLRRMQVEERLEAYESFLDDDPLLAAPLRTLLAVSASRYLTTGERTEFLNAVDQQVTQGTAGVEFLGRGPITVVERSAALPVTLINNQPAPVRVALDLTSDSVDLKQQERAVVTLEPGRNDLSVPVEAAASGRTSVEVTVTTPDQDKAIILAAGSFTVRFVDAEGFGSLILVWAAVALAAWWLHTLRKRARGAGGGATVDAPGSVSGNAEA